MSIVPQAGRNSMPSMVRNLLFWTLMVFLAVVLWQMMSKGGRSGQGSELTYSDFMNQVDANNIQSANFAVMQNTADVSGKLKQPSSDYRSTVPRDTLSALLSKLRQDGTGVQVSENSRGNTMNFLVGIAPIILLVGLWIFMMRMRMKQNSSRPNQPTPGALG